MFAWWLDKLRHFPFLFSVPCVSKTKAVDQLAFVAGGRFKRSNRQPPNGKCAGWPVNQRILKKETTLMGPYWLSVEPAPGPLSNIIQRAAGETKGRSTLKCATKARQNYESQATFVLRCLALGFFFCCCVHLINIPHPFSVLLLLSFSLLFPYISHPRFANNSCTRAHTKSRTS